MRLRDRLEAVEADITSLSVDAVVNAANAALLPGGGVDGAIRRKAGPALDEDLRQLGGCEPGKAVITPGYGLPSAFVIHAVAPIWGGRARAAEQDILLAGCYAAALALADENHVRTIAFPAIGTGAYRWPPDLATKLAFETVIAHLRGCEEQTLVTFCCFARADRERYEALIAHLPD